MGYPSRKMFQGRYNVQLGLTKINAYPFEIFLDLLGIVGCVRLLTSVLLCRLPMPATS